MSISGAFATIDKIQLLIPQYVRRGEDVALACEHSVSPEQLYQVEWHKNRKKIFQYVKGRNPPFRYFHMEGAVLNVRIAVFFTKAVISANIILSSVWFYSREILILVNIHN